MSQDERLSDQEIIEAFIQSGYDIAQICKNGHIINIEATLQEQHNQRYCSKCGAEGIFRCTACNMFIKGGYIWNTHSLNLQFTRPKYCTHCGDAYPWTKRAIQSAKDLVDEIKSLTDDEKSVLKQSIEGIVKDTPQTQLAATRFTRLMIKGGKEVALIAKDILVDVMSEAAKKIIIP